jgi:hypothetical protein
MIKWKWGKPLVSNFSNKLQEGYIETQADAGIPFRRLRFSDSLDLITASFVLSREEYIAFISWYRYDIRQGAIPFLYYDCRIDAERVARIIGNPEYAPKSTKRTVTLTLALEPVTVYNDYILLVNDNDHLIVNDNDKLTVTVGYRY